MKRRNKAPFLSVVGAPAAIAQTDAKPVPNSI
jgi:hypothetical protein